MASITDCVVEGLKYPFNDIKKLLGFGIFFVIFDLLSMIFTFKTVDVTGWDLSLTTNFSSFVQEQTVTNAIKHNNNDNNSHKKSTVFSACETLFPYWEEKLVEKSCKREKDMVQ